MLIKTDKFQIYKLILRFYNINVLCLYKNTYKFIQAHINHIIGVLKRNFIVSNLHKHM